MPQSPLRRQPESRVFKYRYRREAAIVAVTVDATVTVKQAADSNSQFLMVEKQGAIAPLFLTNQEARVFAFDFPRQLIKDSGFPLKNLRE